jgi:hypothetical protein
MHDREVSDGPLCCEEGLRDVSDEGGRGGVSEPTGQLASDTTDGGVDDTCGDCVAWLSAGDVVKGVELCEGEATGNAVWRPRKELDVAFAEDEDDDFDEPLVAIICADACEADSFHVTNNDREDVLKHAVLCARGSGPTGGGFETVNEVFCEASGGYFSLNAVEGIEVLCERA